MVFRKEWQEANTNGYLIKAASCFAVVYFRSPYLDVELCEIRNILCNFLKNRKKTNANQNRKLKLPNFRIAIYIYIYSKHIFKLSLLDR